MKLELNQFCELWHVSSRHITYAFVASDLVAGFGAGFGAGFSASLSAGFGAGCGFCTGAVTGQI